MRISRNKHSFPEMGSPLTGTAPGTSMSRVPRVPLCRAVCLEISVPGLPGASPAQPQSAQSSGLCAAPGFPSASSMLSALTQLPLCFVRGLERHHLQSYRFFFQLLLMGSPIHNTSPMTAKVTAESLEPWC